MKAIVHMGLHKTGTTFIQELCRDQHADLLGQGVYYHPSPHHFAGHHSETWDFLRGNPTGFDTMVRAAIASGAETMLTSSEDLESLIFRPTLAEHLIRTLAEAGVSQVRFDIYIRRQDKLFWSHYSELSKHVFTDPLQYYADVMRLGYYFVDNPRPNDDVSPYWYFCFDHLTHIGRFRDEIMARSAVPCQVVIHDFDQLSGPPGTEIFAAMGTDPFQNQADTNSSNASMTRKEISAKYQGQFRKLYQTHDLTQPQRLKWLVRLRQMLPEQIRNEMSSALMERFSAGNTKLLSAGPTTPLPA